MFAEAWASLGLIEGSFSLDPDDPGGPTKYGITEATARRHGYKERMEDLPPDRAMQFARWDYWDEQNLDLVEQISQGVAYEMFECGYNCGTQVSRRFLQRALNGLNHPQRHTDLVVDGWVGPKTLDALRLYLDARGAEGEQVLLTLLNSLQGARYLDLTEGRIRSRKYLYGWVAKRVTI